MDNIVIPEEVYKSIAVSNDISFINQLLNEDLKLGAENIKLIKAFFNNFKTIKDFSNLIKWDKDYCKNDEIFFICFDTLKNLWVKEKDSKLPKNLCIFISEFFIILSKKRESFMFELIELINSINNKELVLNIFIFILKNKEEKPDSFLEYIYNFINLNIKQGEPLSVYYKLHTIHQNYRTDFLIQNLKTDYAVKVEDFINFPNQIEERITLFTNLYQERYFYNDNYTIEKLDYYKESIKAKDKINTLKYKDAIKVFNNISSFQNLFLFFLPQRINEDNDYLIDILLIEFSENCLKCKEQYNSLKLVLNYWKHFFNFVKKIEINELVNFLNKLENTPLIEFNKYEINMDSFLFYINEAKQNDKLFNSFFFMGLYKDNSMIFQENEEEEKFKYTLLRFNELKSLGINSNFDILSNDLVNKLTELVYKNSDRLDDELSFIKEYFEFDKNSNFFNINKIKREFTNRVNNYKKNNNLDDYEIEFDDDFTLIKANDNDDYKNLINNNKNNNLISNNIIHTTQDDEDDDGFNLLNDDDNFSLLDIKKEKSQKSFNNNKIIAAKEEVNNILITESDKKQLLKEMIQMSYDFYYIYRINNSYGDDAYEGNLIFCGKFTNFFWETFKNIHKYDVLSEKQFYEDVLILMTKIFLSTIGINFFKKENNNKEIFFIYEFYEILEIYKTYHLIKKLQLSKIIEIILECKEKNNDDIINTENIELLFRIIEENLKGRNLFNLPIKLLLINEKIKNDEQYNFKIMDFILRDDNKHLLNDSMPLLDKIFKEEIKSRINLDDEENHNFTKFDNFSLNQLDKKCKDSKDLVELILFYFESQVTKILFGKNKNKKNLNERDIYRNESIKYYLRQCLNILEKESRKELTHENKNISILFCIAFTKCFLSNYIKFLYKKNQELGDVKDINDNIIPGYGNNLFRTTLKLYILKLFYNIIGNYNDFIKFNYDKYQIKYFENEDIIKIKGEDENLSLNNKQKKYGFDYLLITLNANEIEEYIIIEKNLNNLCINENNDNNLVSIVNSSCNLDNFICAIINIFLSNYQDKMYFNSKEYLAISDYLINNLNNNIFNRINDLSKTILLSFIDQNKYENKILKIEENITYGNLSYNQLLVILFSLRYVLNTLLYSNQKKLFYQLIINGQEVFENSNYLINYNKDFNTYNDREINHLTFTIIRFIILSHLYFGFLLNKISFSDINNIFINNDNDLRIIDLLEQEFELIKKIIELKGITNIIVFMNYVFDDIKSIIIDIESENNNLKVIENNIESEISKYLENFGNYMENYNNLIKKIYTKEEKNEFKNIIIEDKKFYNTNNIDKKYPFISYLTINNFSSINDFKNQFLYLINDKYNYPMINCILNNSEIITISNSFPFINSFINEIYNELVLKIKKEDINKEIKDILKENILNQLESFNNKIKEINNFKDFSANKINEININSKVSEVINIKDNSIFKFFGNIIKIYNEFLMNTKIYNQYKNFIEPIIIQNASNNDYINLCDTNDNNYNTFLSPKEKLQEIISLYSKKNRYDDNGTLNVYNGSKINYDFNLIEMMLQKEYLYGKKPFQENQRTFIFSNEVFSEERNNLIENLKNKYPQIDIADEMIKNSLDTFLNDENKTKDNYIQIYINFQYILIQLMAFDKNNYDSENISLDYIAKIVQNSNYQINELFMEFLSQNKDMIHINNLLFLYQKLEIKCFEYLIEEAPNDIKPNEIDEESKLKICEYFKNNDILLKEEIILNSIKKYILRYCIGNNQNEKEILKNIDLDKILNKIDIWDDKILKDEKFKEETKELMKIDNEKNILMKYFLNQLFKIKVEKREENTIIKETKNEKRKRRHKFIKY